MVAFNDDDFRVGAGCPKFGKPLVRGGSMTVAEGEGMARNVVYEFESYEAARAYAFSSEYAAARTLREGAGSIDIIVVEGV